MREVRLPPGKAAVCCCCGSSLYRNVTESLDRTLALAVAGLVLFIPANVYPILGIKIQGIRTSTNLFGAVLSLWDQGMGMIAGFVFGSAILAPAFELTMLIYLLLPLRFHREPPGAARVLRMLRGSRPWGMVDVFMLGVLVSIVKLSDMASLIPGVALLSLAGLTLLLAFVASYFDPRQVWACLDAKCTSGGEG